MEAKPEDNLEKISDLITAFMMNNLKTSDRETLNAWINKDEKNRKLFHDLTDLDNLDTKRKEEQK